MNKVVPYLIVGGVLVLLVALIFFSRGDKSQRRMDERITLRHRDKIPYGSQVAQTLLPQLFPSASCLSDAMAPGYWDSVSNDEPAQAVIIIADYLDADEEELDDLGSFVSKGNYVFLVARGASDAAANYFNLSFASFNNEYDDGADDSLKLYLNQPAFANPSVFTYPGTRRERFFDRTDTATTEVLGTTQNGKPDFIKLNKGKGSFFIHAAPLAFSNYFILHKNNVAYYQAALSVIPANVRTVLWNEYYLDKPQRNNDDKEPDWLGALFQQSSFKWGLLVAMSTLALYLLLGMRRKQRIIPPYTKPSNDSLDFVKTLGRLYYDKKDHRNLANKMATYFLDHVRSVYKLPTHTLDAAFVQQLQTKSSYPVAATQRLVDSINQLKTAPSFTEGQLAAFYKSLEHFYQNT